MVKMLPPPQALVSALAKFGFKDMKRGNVFCSSNAPPPSFSPEPAQRSAPQDDLDVAIFCSTASPHPWYVPLAFLSPSLPVMIQFPSLFAVSTRAVVEPTLDVL
jgi:hypothetical protein